MHNVLESKLVFSMINLTTMIFLLLLTTMGSSNPPIALPNCQDHCGNMNIPYPFGIGANCSHNSWFEIKCNTTYNPPRAYSTRLNWKGPLSSSQYPVQILQIVLPNSSIPYPTITITGSWAGLASGSVKSLTTLNTLDMRGTPFLLMGSRNTFVVFGCGGSAQLRNRKGEIVAGCATICNDTLVQLLGSSCYGIGCCQALVTDSIDYFEMEFLATIGDGRLGDSVQAAVFDSSYMLNKKTINGSFLEYGSDPTLLNWKVPDLRTDSGDYSNASCYRNGSSLHLPVLYCSCKRVYYQGNPYLPNGCQVIKECEQCPDDCVEVGNATYNCPPFKSRKATIPIVLGLGISLGSICLFLVLYGLYGYVKKRQEIRQKQSNFKKNGGLLLQQQMSAGEGVIERTKVFTSNELEKATDNFNENRILGRGGQGTVYKGMLTDGTIVAIKKSKKVDETQLGQFINEVVILSQVNHRNVVKLFGCCLETEVPLLVYEYVLNGTLYQHIHTPSEDFRISWKLRLRIALESAEAIAYLHSSSSTPIYHRDIKTSNILLDEKYRAKVSDFGTSKTLSIDQTHVTTCVQGTFGYIDPEFFQSNQFTEKSDVYSFGIVLLELLTSKKPIHADTSLESRSLASEFLLLMQSSRLYDIVDTEVLEEARKEEVEGIAELAKRCLQLHGKERPTMKEVAMALQTLSQQKFNGKQNTSFLDDQIHVGDGGLLSNSNISSSSDNSSIYTQPLLFSTNSDM